jgi:acylpyruvate hydrolase
MLSSAVPTSPVLFLKPSSSLITAPQQIEIPPSCTELHHEIELGVVIGKEGRDIPLSQVSTYISGYVVALDMTARQLQEVAKQGRLPWAVSKGYDTFCPISSQVIPTSALPDLKNVEVWCAVDGTERQRGNTKNMLFPVHNLISYISTIFTLTPGDLILTGTPEGVGPLKPGQTITGGITGLKEYDIEFKATQRQQPKL